ncbi:unnamed protein product [Orchesella dallaii]|uniref:Uncharacterized protein n=1 Tax=Orchesella dallaii TaxID=48710 RepID=A0ABP1QQG7_9HEXA
MRFLSISMILVIHQVLASKERLVLPSQEIEFYDSKAPVGFSSAHIPSFLPSLNLNPTELKLFAGHSLQLIKSKCPAVPHDTLAQLNKYISKLISKTNPVPNKSEQFAGLVTSITTCEKKDKEDTFTLESPLPSFLQEIVAALQSMFGSKDQDPVDVELEVVEDNTSNRPMPMTMLSFDEDHDYMLRPSADQYQKTITDVRKPDEQVTEEQTTEGDDDAPTKDDSVADNEAGRETPSTETTPLETSKIPITTEPTSTFVFETYIPMGSYFSPSSWFGSMFDMMRNFFANIFGDGVDGDDLGTSSPALSRAKRAAVGQLETIIEKTDMTVESTAPANDKTDASEEAPEDNFFIVRLDNDQARAPNSDVVAPPAPVKVTGKDAFANVIDNLCRIYCHECSDRKQIINFKSAAKELLEFISKDTTGIELAAKHYLSPDFMNSLNEC